MSFRSLSSITQALVFVFAFCSALLGQGTGGAVKGHVFDPNGAPIPDVSITVKSGSGTAGFERTLATDSKGYFFLPELPPGSYRIVAESKHFRTFATDFESFVDDVRVQDIWLSPVAGTAVVVEIPDPARSAGASPEIRTTFNTSFLNRLPSRTTFFSLAGIVPNARPEVLAAGLQIDGNSGSDNTYFVDGQEVTNFRSGLLPVNFDLPFELVRETQIRSTDIAPEYAGATGGVINIVTRGGGNDWRGEFGVSFVTAGLSGSANTVINRYGSGAGQTEFLKPAKDGGTSYFPAASLGGPILRNRLWFFAAYAPQIARITRTIDYFTSPDPALRTVRESIPYRQTVRGEQAFTRIDAQPVSRLRLFATYLYNPVIQDGALPPVSEGLAGVPQEIPGLRGAGFLATRGGRQNSQFVSGQATVDATKHFLATVRGGYGFLNEKLDSYGIPKITRFICNAGGTPPPDANCAPGFQNIANNSVRDYQVSKRTTFGFEGQINGLGPFGRHHMRFGYDFNRVSDKIREGYTDTGIVQLLYGRSIETMIGLPATPGNLGSGFLQRFGNVAAAAGRNQGFYFQDSWTIARRLTLGGGLRVEKENLPRYRDPIYPSSVIVVAGEFDLEWNWGDKISPRIAGVFDLFGDGKSKVFASFGLYYDRMKFNALQTKYAPVFYRDWFEILPARGAAYSNYTYRNILGGNPDFPGGQCPIVNTQGWSICQLTFTVSTNVPVIVPILPDIDGDLLPSRTREFTAGFEQRLPGGSALTGRYVYRNLDRTVEDVGTISAQGGELFSIVNPGSELICGVAAETGLPCPKAQRRYDALEVVFDKRETRYFLNLSYTFSRLFGNYAGLANSDEGGRAAPNNGRNFDLPTAGFTADGAPDNGRLATDRPHVFKAYGGYSFSWFDRSENVTSVSAITTIASGTPLTTVYTLFNIQNSVLYGRGDLGRTETLSGTDLRIAHRFSFGRDDRLSIEPFAVLLNLFDERNELGRQTSISATNFTASALTQGGCTVCTNQAAVYQAIHNGLGISRSVLNYLGARGTSSTGIRNDYNLTNSYQIPRSVRFGIRVAF